MDNKYTNTDIFKSTECPSDALLLAYAKDNIGKEDKRLVELHLVDCDMCNDMVEGYQSMNPEHIETNISSLEKKIDDAVAAQSQKGTIAKGFKWYYAVAAILIIGLTGALYQFYFQSLEGTKVADVPELQKISGVPPHDSIFEETQAEEPSAIETIKAVKPLVFESDKNGRTMNDDVPAKNAGIENEAPVQETKNMREVALADEVVLSESANTAATDGKVAQNLDITSTTLAQPSFAAPAPANAAFTNFSNGNTAVHKQEALTLKDVEIVSAELESKKTSKANSKFKDKAPAEAEKKEDISDSEKAAVEKEINSLAQGQALMKQKQYQLAMDKFNEHFKKHPKDCDATLGVAQSNEGLKNNKEAIKYYIQLSKFNCGKQSDSAYLKLAELYLLNNQKEMAKETLVKAHKSKFLDIAEEAKKLLDGL